MKIIINTDGSSKGNPGQSTIGIILKDEHGNTLKKIGKQLGYATSNQAEYQALLEGVKAAKKLGATQIHCNTDSMILKQHLSNQIKIINPMLVHKILEIKHELKDFDDFYIKHVPREQNIEADRIANMAHIQELDSLD